MQIDTETRDSSPAGYLADSFAATMATFRRHVRAHAPILLPPLFLFLAYKIFLTDVYGALDLAINSVVALLLGLLFCNWDYRILHESYRLLLRGILLINGIYLVLNYYAYVPEPNFSYAGLEFLRLLAIGLTLLGLYRPALSLMPLTFTIWRKDIDELATGIHTSGTDYLPVVEIGLFLSIAFIWMVLIRLSARRAPALKHIDERTTSMMFVYIAIASHFANYFYSGLAKVLLPGGPVSWALENNTFLLQATARVQGLSPVGHLDALWDTLFHLSSVINLPLNFFVLSIQIAAVVSLSSFLASKILTTAYDAMHLTIFAFTGIFFWKWILLNAVILAVFQKLQADGAPRMPTLYACGAVVLAPLFFFTAHLGWYDTPMVTETRVFALTEEGEYKVPTNYFLSVSLSFAQGRVGKPFRGHLQDSGSLGTTMSYQKMKDYLKCTPHWNGRQSEQLSSTTLSQYRDYLRQHHRYVIEADSRSTGAWYDFFPHHMWSNPFSHDSFATLNKRDITAYRIVVRTECVIDEDGEYAPVVYRQSEGRVDI